MSIIRDLRKRKRRLIFSDGKTEHPMPGPDVLIGSLGAPVYVDLTDVNLEDLPMFDQPMLCPWQSAWLEWHDQGPERDGWAAVQVSTGKPTSEFPERVRQILFSYLFLTISRPLADVLMMGISCTPLDSSGFLFRSLPENDDVRGVIVKLHEAISRQFFGPSAVATEPPLHDPECFISSFIGDPRFREQILATMNVALTSFGLLNCENICVSEVGRSVSRRSQREKRRSGLTWHRLVIVKPESKRIHGVTVPNGTGDPFTREHLCRGHFKNYTAEKPLFGRLTGRYWWAPHVRGSHEVGTVLKDYRVRRGDLS